MTMGSLGAWYSSAGWAPDHPEHRRDLGTYRQCAALIVDLGGGRFRANVAYGLDTLEDVFTSLVDAQAWCDRILSSDDSGAGFAVR